MWRATALVKRPEGLDSSEFDRAWSQRLVPAIQEALERHGAVQRLVLCQPPPTLSNRVETVFPPQFDGMLAIWFDRAEDATAAFAVLASDESLRATAAEAVSANDSVAFLAQAIPPVLNGESNVTFVAGSDIAKHSTLEQAQDYYVNFHPRVAQSVPETWKFLAYYAQFCGDPTTTLDVGQWLAKYRFIPLASDIGFADADDFIAMYGHPSYMSIIRPDEQKFSDASEMIGYLTGRETVLLDRTVGRF